MVELELLVDPSRVDVDCFVELSPTLEAGSWQSVDSTPLVMSEGKQVRQAHHPTGEDLRYFYRLGARLKQ